MKVSEYKNYGKVVEFEKNGITLKVTIDLGPRIIFYGKGEQNFMNEDLDRNVSIGGEHFDKSFGDGTKWYLYGGHRIWKSPENMESYTPDNFPVEYILTENGGEFTSTIAKELDYTLCVNMREDGSVDIKNIVRNKSDKIKELAVWALTVVAKGGVLVLPLNDMVDHLNPTQNLVQWPYNDLSDARLKMSHKFLTLKHSANPDALKLGLFLKKGTAFYVLNGKALKVKYQASEGNYPDFGCNFETYTNQHILEVEVLSALKKLSKNECNILEESWSIIDDVNVDCINLDGPLNDECLKKFNNM